MDKDLCLDVYKASKDSGANVDQWTCNGGANQVWLPGVNPTWNVYYNWNSLCVLDVWHAGTSDGTNVDQYTYNGNNNQLWELVDWV